MRRLVLAIVLALGGCGAMPQLAMAQRPTAPADTEWALPPHTWAITYCEKDGDTLAVRIAVNAAALSDTALLNEVLIHEFVHRRDILADRRLCRPTWAQLLTLEIHAYSISMKVEILQGKTPTRAYLDVLDRLLGQFNGALPAKTVEGAWYAAEGKTLGLGTK